MDASTWTRPKPRLSILHIGDDSITSLRGFEGAPRIVSGIAATGATCPDKFGQPYRLELSGAKFVLPVPLFGEHAKDIGPAGEIYHVHVTGDRIFVRASIFENRLGDAAWEQIRSGARRCLSVGWTSDQKHKAVGLDANVYRAWRLMEVSFCREGADPHARLAVGADSGWDA